jgi:hypothetical protein
MMMMMMINSAFFLYLTATMLQCVYMFMMMMMIPKFYNHKTYELLTLRVVPVRVFLYVLSGLFKSLQFCLVLECGETGPSF